MNEFRQSQFFRGSRLTAPKNKQGRRWLWVAAPAALALAIVGGVAGYRDFRPQHVIHDQVTAPAPHAIDPTPVRALLPNTGNAGLLPER